MDMEMARNVIQACGVLRHKGLTLTHADIESEKECLEWLARQQRPSFYKSAEWRQARYEVLKEQGRRCSCCGETPSDGRRVHVDHIKPRSKYPELELDKTNLQILCDDCNLGKSNTDEIRW